jgi:hypothetical protein
VSDDIKEGMTVRPAVIPSSRTVSVKVSDVYRDISLDDYGDIEEWALQRLKEIKTSYTGLFYTEETIASLNLEIEQVAQAICAFVGAMPTWSIKVTVNK